MSVDFDASGNDTVIFDGAVNTPITLDDYTMLIRIKPDASQSHGVARACVVGSTLASLYMTSTQMRMQMSHGGNNATWQLVAGFANQWYQIVVRGESGTTHSDWVDGTRTNTGTTYTNSADVTGVTNNGVSIGGRAGADQDFDGLVCDYVIWNDQVPDDACMAMSQGLDSRIATRKVPVFRWDGRRSILNEDTGNANLALDDLSPTLVLNDNPPVRFAG